MLKTTRRKCRENTEGIGKGLLTGISEKEGTERTGNGIT